jgi:hypothetical protein
MHRGESKGPQMRKRQNPRKRSISQQAALTHCHSYVACRRAAIGIPPVVVFLHYPETAGSIVLANARIAARTSENMTARPETGFRNKIMLRQDSGDRVSV